MTTRYDLALFQPATSGPYTQALQTADLPARRVSGIEKLGQRFILELFTEQGSIPYLSSRGCDFATNLRRGWVLTEYDAFAAFAAAVLQAAANLQAEDSTSDPDDERLAGAQLVSLSVAPETTTLTIAVHSVTGSSTTLQVPLEFEAAPAGARYVAD